MADTGIENQPSTSKREKRRPEQQIYTPPGAKKGSAAGTGAAGDHQSTENRSENRNPERNRRPLPGGGRQSFQKEETNRSSNRQQQDSYRTQQEGRNRQQNQGGGGCRRNQQIYRNDGRGDSSYHDGRSQNRDREEGNRWRGGGRTFARNSEERTSGRSDFGGNNSAFDRDNRYRGGNQRGSYGPQRRSLSSEGKQGNFYREGQVGLSDSRQYPQDDPIGCKIWEQNPPVQSPEEWTLPRAGSERPSSPTPSVTSVASSRGGRRRRQNRNRKGGKQKKNSGDPAELPPKAAGGGDGRNRNQNIIVKHQKQKYGYNDDVFEPSPEKESARGKREGLYEGRVAGESREKDAPGDAENKERESSNGFNNEEWKGEGKTFQSTKGKGEAEDWKKYASAGRTSQQELPSSHATYGSCSERGPAARSTDSSDRAQAGCHVAHEGKGSLIDDLLLKHGTEHMDWSQEVEEECARKRAESTGDSGSGDHQREQIDRRAGLLPLPKTIAGSRPDRLTSGDDYSFGQDPYYQQQIGSERNGMQRYAGYGRGAPPRGSLRAGGNQYYGTDQRSFIRDDQRRPPAQQHNASGRGMDTRRIGGRHTASEVPPRFQKLQKEQNQNRFNSEQQLQRQNSLEERSGSNAFRMQIPSEVPSPQGIPSGLLHLPRGQLSEHMKQTKSDEKAAVLDRIQQDILPRIDHVSSKLNQLLQQASRGGEISVEKLHGLRLDLESEYKQLLPMDLEYSFQQNLESRMWKEAFWNPIETFRLLESNRGGQIQMKEILIQILDQSVEFYDSLVREYEDQFHFNLDEQLYEIQSGPPSVIANNDFQDFGNPEFPSLSASVGGRPPAAPGTAVGNFVEDELRKCLCLKWEVKSRTVKFALHSCQRFLLALGDIERYRGLVTKTMEFGKARKYYLKAFQLGPNNGRCYNQLALLALYTNRRLDAVYYFIRALAAKHKFDTASQSLREAFEVLIREKAESYEKELRSQVENIKAQEASRISNMGRGKLRASGGRRRPISMRTVYSRSGLDSADDYNTDERGQTTARREVWIGGRTEKGESDENGDKLGKRNRRTDSDIELDLLLGYSTNEMYKRMVTYFLDAVGTLVLKIGMERFEERAEKALRQLQELLRSKSENPLTAMQLVKLATVAIYCIHSTAEAVMVEQGTCSQRLQHSVQLTLSLWGLLMDQVQSRMVVPDHLQNPESMPVELQRVLPAAHLISHWISTPSVYNLYSSLPSLDGFDTEKFTTEVWVSLARLCNRLSFLEREKMLVEFFSGPKSGFSVPVMLPEEWLTTSFFDIYESKAPAYYFPESSDMDMCAMHIRLKGILQAGEYLHGMELRHFRYDTEQEQFIAITPEPSPCSSPTRVPIGRRTAASDDELEEGEIDDLSRATNALNFEDMDPEFQQLQMQRMGEMGKQAALDQEAQNQGLVLEICPSVLVPDTNGFIDHLRLMKLIVECGLYSVAIPIVVMNELDGLRRNEDEWVSSQSQSALDFLESTKREQGTSSRKKIQLVTSQGNFVSSLSFSTNEESSSSKELNDDRILNCCTALIIEDFQAMDRRRDLKNEPVKLQRKVVLLTDDRALRVKALSNNVPVRTIPSFVEWAGIESGK